MACLHTRRGSTHEGWRVVKALALLSERARSKMVSIQGPNQRYDFDLLQAVLDHAGPFTIRDDRGAVLQQLTLHSPKMVADWCGEAHQRALQRRMAKPLAGMLGGEQVMVEHIAPLLAPSGRALDQK
eukprot:10316439-Alexandrium_andersonii.AAC.1